MRQTFGSPILRPIYHQALSPTSLSCFRLTRAFINGTRASPTTTTTAQSHSTESRPAFQTWQQKLGSKVLVSFISTRVQRSPTSPRLSPGIISSPTLKITRSLCKRNRKETFRVKHRGSEPVHPVFVLVLVHHDASSRLKKHKRNQYHGGWALYVRAENRQAIIESNQKDAVDGPCMYRGIPEVAPLGWYRPRETSILSRLYPSLFTLVKSVKARAPRLSKSRGNWVILRPNNLLSAVGIAIRGWLYLPTSIGRHHNL